MAVDGYIPMTTFGARIKRHLVGFVNRGLVFTATPPIGPDLDDEAGHIVGVDIVDNALDPCRPTVGGTGHGATETVLIL